MHAGHVMKNNETIVNCINLFYWIFPKMIRYKEFEIAPHPVWPQYLEREQTLGQAACKTAAIKVRDMRF